MCGSRKQHQCIASNYYESPSWWLKMVQKKFCATCVWRHFVTKLNPPLCKAGYRTGRVVQADTDSRLHVTLPMLCILMRWIYRQQLQLLLGKPNYIYSFASALHPLRPPPQTWFSSCDKPRTVLARFFTTIHWRTCSYPLTAAVELLNCKQDFSNLKKICSTVSPTYKL